MTQPRVLISGNMREHYEYRVMLEGKKPLQYGYLYQDKFNNDDMDSRGRWGAAHTWAFEKAYWLCNQLNIPISRIFIKPYKCKNYRKLTSQEQTYLK